MSVFSEMRGTWDLGFFIANHLPSYLPTPVAGRLRPRLLRAIGGVRMGRASFIQGAFQLNATQSPGRNLQIGSNCYINTPLFLDINATITLGDFVYIGPHTKIITTNHEISGPECRAGKLAPLPVTIGNGAWIAGGVMILPGVTVGAGAIVAAGAVVTKDVPANTLVGGVPAKVIRAL